MLNVSKDFLKAIADTRRTMFIQIKINDILYTNDNITKFELDSGSMGGNSLGIGSTFANTIKLEFCQVIEGLKETDIVEVSIGIKVHENGAIQPLEYPFRLGSARIGYAQLTSYTPDEIEFVPLGKFYIKGRVDPDRNENKTTLEAMDAWMFMEGIYESKLKYPAPLRSVALEIANLSGAEINGPSLNAVSSTLIDKPIGYTYRQALSIVSQIEGKYARFDREGLLQISALEDPNYLISTNEYYMKGLVKNEVLFRIGGISCKVTTKDAGGNEVTKTLQAGSDKGSQIVLENNVMTQVLLDSLYNKIKSINFYPYMLKWRGNPALEAGDWITMIDRKGNKFKVPNFNYKLTYSGGLTAISSADTTPASDVAYKYKGPLSQTIDNMDQRIDAAGKNTVYEGIDEPPYPKEGDLWFKPNGPDKELWIYMLKEDGSYGWVMQTSTAPNDELLKELEESAKKAEEAKKAADKAKDLAENAIPKDEPIKSINESPELIQVVGGKLHISTQTVFDEAIIKTAYLVDASITSAKIGELAVDTAHIKDAAITNAKIKDLSADKINAGTINAAKINVINMNASNISTGTITGANLNINLNTGSVTFQRGRIANSTGRINIDLDNSLIYFKGTTPQTAVMGDRGFVVYDGTPTSSNIDIYDEKIIAAIGKFSSRPSVVGNGSIEVASYRYSTTSGGSVQYSRAGSFRIDTNGNVIISSDENKRIQIGYVNSETIIMSKSTQVNGNFKVVGTKNAIHVTRDGVRATPAYETAESYLGDIGEDSTNDKGQCVIHIEELFSDTVNTQIPYQVFLSSYSKGDIWVEKRTPISFLVKSSEPNVSFAWEIKAKRRGYEQDRLVLDETFDNNKIEETWKKEHN